MPNLVAELEFGQVFFTLGLRCGLHFGFAPSDLGRSAEPRQRAFGRAYPVLLEDGKACCRDITASDLPRPRIGLLAIRDRFGDRLWKAPVFLREMRGRQRQGKKADGSARIREATVLTIYPARRFHPETGEPEKSPVSEIHRSPAGAFILGPLHCVGYTSAALRALCPDKAERKKQREEANARTEGRMGRRGRCRVHATSPQA